MSRRTKRALTSLSVIAAGAAPALAFVLWQQPSDANAQAEAPQGAVEELSAQPGSQLAQMQPTAPSGNEAAPRPDAAPRDVTASPEIARPRSGQDATASASEDVGSPRTVAIPEDAPAPREDAGGAQVANGSVAVQLDHARVVRLPERTQTVIVGNPIIADVTVQRNGILVVTGKSYGTTNLIALDSTGALLAESMISVEATTEAVVTVQRGLARESYSCTPTCQPSLRLGDSPGHFDGVGSQATQRNELATRR